MTEPRNFFHIVQVKKSTTCKSCKTYEYRLPLPVTKELAEFLAVLGQTKYPMSRTNIIRIENEYVSIRSLAGTNQVRIKYIKDADSQQKVAEMQLAAYLEHTLGIPVEYN